MSRLPSWGFALVLLPLAACNSTPGNPLGSTVPVPQTLPSVSAVDQRFLDQTGSATLFEIQSAQLALQRSRNPRTRSYAQRVLDDYATSNQRLAQLAQGNGVQLPTAMGPEQQRSYAAIENTRQIFDSEYFRQQAMALQNAITVAENEVSSGYNNDIKAFAQDSLPVMRRHLEMAESGRQMPMGRIPARR